MFCCKNLRINYGESLMEFGRQSLIAYSVYLSAMVFQDAAG